MLDRHGWSPPASVHVCSMTVRLSSAGSGQPLGWPLRFLIEMLLTCGGSMAHVNSIIESMSACASWLLEGTERRWTPTWKVPTSAHWVYAQTLAETRRAVPM